MAFDVTQPAVEERAPQSFAAKVVLFDTLLFALFIFDRVTVGPLPLGVGLASFIGFIGLCRRPKRRVRPLAMLLVCYFLLLAYLLGVSLLFDSDWETRIVRFMILGVLAWVLAEGRFDAYSAVLGVVIGLGINIPLFYLGLTPNRYPPHLTGFLGDKNVAGLWYGIFAVVALLLWRSKVQSVLWLLVAGGVLFLTGSRTSMSGVAAALAWILMRNRLGVLARSALAGGLMWALWYAEENFARAGVFADRDGTDWFRDQIDMAVKAKVAITEWYGQGLGNAWVIVGGDTRMLFHNAFDGLRVEGGWPFLLVWLFFVLVTLGGVHRSHQVPREQVILEGALVVLLVCSWKLGETFFTSVAFIVTGLMLYHRHGEPIEEPDPWSSDLVQSESALGTERSH